MANFKDRFRELTKSSEHDIAQLQSLLNISSYQYYNWQNGRGEPDTETLKKIAIFFDVSLDWLLGASDEKKPAVNLAADALQKLDEFRALLAHSMIQMDEYRELLQLKKRKYDPDIDLPPEAVKKINEYRDLLRLQYQKKGIPD